MSLFQLADHALHIGAGICLQGCVSENNDILMVIAHRTQEIVIRIAR